MLWPALKKIVRRSPVTSLSAGMPQTFSAAKRKVEFVLRCVESTFANVDNSVNKILLNQIGPRVD